MTDELERRLTDALHAARLPSAPDSLKQALERIPIEAATGRTPRRRSLAWAGAFLIALGVIALFVAGLAVGLLGPAAPATPTPVPSMSPVTGIQWTTTLPATPPLRTADDVIMSALVLGNGYLAAGTSGRGTGAVLWYSPDGLSWERIGDDPVFADSLLDQLVPMPGGILAVGTANHVDALCPTGAGTDCHPVLPVHLWTSSDGRTWQRLPDSVTAVFGRASTFQVASGPAGLVAFGLDTPQKVIQEQQPRIWISKDGRTWTAAPQFQATYPNTVMDAIAALPTGFIGVGRNHFSPGPVPGDGAAWFSLDGTVWTKATIPTSGDELTQLFTARDGALATLPGSGPLWSTADGRTWQVVDPTSIPFAIDSQPVSFVSDGQQILAIGSGKDDTPGAWVSTDGRTWRALPETNPPALAGPAIGALGPKGTVLVAPASSADQASTVWFGTFGATAPAPTLSPTALRASTSPYSLALAGTPQGRPALISTPSDCDPLPSAWLRSFCVLTLRSDWHAIVSPTDPRADSATWFATMARALIDGDTTLCSDIAMREWITLGSSFGGGPSPGVTPTPVKPIAACLGFLREKVPTGSFTIDEPGGQAIVRISVNPNATVRVATGSAPNFDPPLGCAPPLLRDACGRLIDVVTAALGSSTSAVQILLASDQPVGCASSTTPCPPPAGGRWLGGVLAGTGDNSALAFNVADVGGQIKVTEVPYHP